MPGFASKPLGPTESPNNDQVNVIKTWWEDMYRIKPPVNSNIPDPLISFVGVSVISLLETELEMISVALVFSGTSVNSEKYYVCV